MKKDKASICLAAFEGAGSQSNGMEIKCSEKRDQGVSCLCAKAENIVSGLSNVKNSAVIKKGDSGTVIGVVNIDKGTGPYSCNEVCVNRMGLFPLMNYSQGVCLVAWEKTKSGSFVEKSCSGNLPKEYGGKCLCAGFIGTGIEEFLNRNSALYNVNSIKGSSIGINLGGNRSIIGLFNGRMVRDYDKNVCDSCSSLGYLADVAYDNGQCLKDFVQSKKESCKEVRDVNAMENCTARGGKWTPPNYEIGSSGSCQICETSRYPHSYSLCAGIVTPQNNP